MREIALQTRQLTKRYRNFTALDRADMTVYREDIYGLIGRNGAGKTTLMKTVTGLTEATEGSYEIFQSERVNKKRIGCLIENPAFFGNLSAYQNLKYYCYQKGVTDLGQIDEALELVGLTGARKKKFRKFSLGMKQRLGIAFAILDHPDLLILDEPINGLDPIGISELRETFRKLRRERGMTIIISSHILSELYEVANRFLFIEKGCVLKELTKEELDLACMRCLVIRVDEEQPEPEKTGGDAAQSDSNMEGDGQETVGRDCGAGGHLERAVALLEERLKINDYKVTDAHEIRIYQDGIRPVELNRMLVEQGIPVSGIYESGVSLEDYFKSLVGEV